MGKLSRALTKKFRHYLLKMKSQLSYQYWLALQQSKFKEKLLTDEAIALRQQGQYDQAAKSF
jgi:hypothetical protein